MKKIILTLFCACMMGGAMAKVLTTCPDGKYPAGYTTLQAAHDAATDGDTIYVYPGNYAEQAQFTKRLTIIGPGIAPLRPDARPAKVNTIWLNSTNCSGSVIMGLWFTDMLQTGNLGMPVNDLKVSHCRADHLFSFLGGGDNIIMQDCILYSDMSSASGYIRVSGDNHTGIVIQNCYIHGMVILGGGYDAMIRNCVFASGSANDYAFGGNNGVYSLNWGSGVTVQNNIFYKIDPYDPKGLSATAKFLNNIAYLTTDPVPSNAYSSGNRTIDPLFVNFPAAGDRFSFAYDYHLQAGSPGKNYGTDGTDIGMWGGSLPVNTGFEPPIPRITQLKVDHPIVPAGGTVKLTLKAGKPN